MDASERGREQRERALVREAGRAHSEGFAVLRSLFDPHGAEVAALAHEFASVFLGAEGTAQESKALLAGTGTGGCTAPPPGFSPSCIAEVLPPSLLELEEQQGEDEQQEEGLSLRRDREQFCAVRSQVCLDASEVLVERVLFSPLLLACVRAAMEGSCRDQEEDEGSRTEGDDHFAEGATPAQKPLFLLHEQFVAKPPAGSGFNTAFALHRDGDALPAASLLDPTVSYVSCWIAVTDASVHSGTLEVCRRGDTPEKDTRAVEVSAGDAILLVHDCWHKSSLNELRAWRLAYLPQYSSCVVFREGGRLAALAVPTT